MAMLTALEDPGSRALWTTTWMGTLFGTMLFPPTAGRNLGKSDGKQRAGPLRAPWGARELGRPPGCSPQTCTLPGCPRPHPRPHALQPSLQETPKPSQQKGRCWAGACGRGRPMAPAGAGTRDTGHKDPSFPQPPRDGGTAEDARWHRPPPGSPGRRFC